MGQEPIADCDQAPSSVIHACCFQKKRKAYFNLQDDEANYVASCVYCVCGCWLPNILR